LTLPVNQKPILGANIENNHTADFFLLNNFSTIMKQNILSRYSESTIDLFTKWDKIS
jgi:hypothetical protein